MDSKFWLLFGFLAVFAVTLFSYYPEIEQFQNKITQTKNQASLDYQAYQTENLLPEDKK